MPVTGLAAAKDNLRKVKAATARIMGGALKKGAAIVAKEMKRRAPVGPKNSTRRRFPQKALKRRIKVTKAPPRRGEVANALAKSAAPHSHLNELGTVDRRRKSGGWTGRMKAKPFARPAVEATRGAVEAAIRDEMAKRLETEIAKIYGASRR